MILDQKSKRHYFVHTLNMHTQWFPPPVFAADEPPEMSRSVPHSKPNVPTIDGLSSSSEEEEEYPGPIPLVITPRRGPSPVTLASLALPMISTLSSPRSKKAEIDRNISDLLGMHSQACRASATPRQMVMNADIRVGMRVVHRKQVGTVRFRGYLGGHECLGVELSLPKGNNDGTYAGQRIFACGDNCGVFTTPGEVEMFAPSYGTATLDGYLTKQGGRFKTWKLRWCALVGLKLYYFEGPISAEAKGSVDIGLYHVDPDVPLESICEWRLKPDAGKIASKRVYIFLADSQSERDEWVRKIIETRGQR